MSSKFERTLDELGWPRDIDLATAKMSRRVKLSECHPDKPGGDSATFTVVKQQVDYVIDYLIKTTPPVYTCQFCKDAKQIKIGTGFKKTLKKCPNC